MSGSDDRKSTGITGRSMCEAISKWFKEKHGKDVAPKDIWNSSPTGELSHVFDLYEQAKADGYAAATSVTLGERVGQALVAGAKAGTLFDIDEEDKTP